MKVIPVALAVFYRTYDELLEVWTQVREDDGVYHGLLEFPGGKIEPDETPSRAAVREVEEEVGISINQEDAIFMGQYPQQMENRVILLNVYLFPDQESLKGKGKWLKITQELLSSPYKNEIPLPNHQIIDDLYRALYS